MERTAHCRSFYDLRDRRTVEYLGHPIGNLMQVHVAIDAAAATSPAGQLALLALANQLARVCRRISFELPLPDAPVVARTPFEGSTLSDAVNSTVRAIDPCGEFRIGRRPSNACVAIGLGGTLDQGFDWYIGADRAIAFLRRSPVAFTDCAGTLRGVALASCLGSAAVLRRQLGLPVAERTLSAWNYAEGVAAAPGPDSLESVDVGRVLMVGAGAVGAALAFWLHAFGVNSDGWAVVDHDKVELHNTNRGLLFTARHAGWPRGQSVNKVEIVGKLLPGATTHDCWLHECAELTGRTFDVVLALANDHDARELLTHLCAAISMQATTGDNWLSQLHRHILGRDGCIWCRTGQIKATAFECSTGTVVQTDGSKSDAALPFLSAASGLMLASALQRLSSGELQKELANCWSWDFGSEHRMTPTATARHCREGCALVAPPRLRRKLVAGSRWADVILAP